MRIAAIQDFVKTNGSLSSGGQDPCKFLDHLSAWLLCAEELATYYGSRTQRTVRLVAAGRKRANLAGVVNRIAPDPHTVVLFGANFFGRTCRTGDVAGPVVVKGIRRALAKQRVVFVVDEFNTTKCHVVCGAVMEADPRDRHEKWCRTCDAAVDRDTNAARNIKCVWQQRLRDGRRPVWLQRPAWAPRTTVV